MSKFLFLKQTEINMLWKWIIHVRHATNYFVEWRMDPIKSVLPCLLLLLLFFFSNLDNWRTSELKKWMRLIITELVLAPTSGHWKKSILSERDTAAHWRSVWNCIYPCFISTAWTINWMRLKLSYGKQTGHQCAPFTAPLCSLASPHPFPVIIHFFFFLYDAALFSNFFFSLSPFLCFWHRYFCHSISGAFLDALVLGFTRRGWLCSQLDIFCVNSPPDIDLGQVPF